MRKKSGGNGPSQSDRITRYFRPYTIVAGRAVAFFIGGFGLLNILGDIRTPGFDSNIWWVDTRPLPAVLGKTVVAVASAVLLAYAARPQYARLRYSFFAATGVLGAFVLKDIVYFYVGAAAGDYKAGFFLPFSAIAAVGLGFAALSSARNAEEKPSTLCAIAFIMPLIAAFAVAAPLAQMFCFGKTDYRREAGAIVVFGARTYADGTPSMMLADRVRTACELYLEGFADKVIFSGGPGDAAVHETDAMKRLALECGVSENDIIIDRNGLSTDATVDNTSKILNDMGIDRILAVSNFYHLPRIKMTYARAGISAYTIPAADTRTPRQLPFYLVREVAALWVYYFRPVISY